MEVLSAFVPCPTLAQGSRVTAGVLRHLKAQGASRSRGSGVTVTDREAPTPGVQSPEELIWHTDVPKQASTQMLGPCRWAPFLPAIGDQSQEFARIRSPAIPQRAVRPIQEVAELDVRQGHHGRRTPTLNWFAQ